jgi:DNA-directed RNA polymerase specialized sigma24 family protein
MAVIDGCERYFIEFYGQSDSPEVEVNFEIFNEYYKEFSKPMERQRNEKRRHIKSGGIGELSRIFEEEDNLILKYSFEEALKTCTPVQQKRFELHYVQGYSLEEIARFENCGKQHIKKSIDAAVEKIQKYFS